MWNAGRIAGSKHFGAGVKQQIGLSLCWGDALPHIPHSSPRAFIPDPQWSPIPGMLEAMFHNSLLEPQSNPSVVRWLEIPAGGRAPKAKGYLSQDMRQACVLPQPPLRISVSWRPLKPGVVLILALFYTFSVCVFFSFLLIHLLGALSNLKSDGLGVC